MCTPANGTATAEPARSQATAERRNQPRATGGRRWIYQRDLPVALDDFDRIILTAPYEHRPAAHMSWEHEPFSLEMLAGALVERGKDVTIEPRIDALPSAIVDAARDDDVVLLSLRDQPMRRTDAIIDALSERVPART